MFDFADKGNNARWHEEDDDRETRELAGGKSSPPEAFPHARTEKNYLALIAAMAIDKYNYDSAAARSAVPGDLSALAGAHGFTLSAETIRKYLDVGAGHLNATKRR